MRVIARNRPTIVQVAERAGVSKSLVSLVMRESPHVSDASRRAVLAAAAELGYRPNTVARSLVQQRSFVIGLMVSDLSNPFFTDLIHGASQNATEHGYSALVNTGYRDSDAEVEAIETLMRMQADGLILAAPVVSSRRLAEIGRETPTVVTNRGTRSKLVDSVVIDDHRGATLAVDHLVGLGHRRIACITGGSGAGARNRVNGYEHSMQDHGLADHLQVVDGSYTEEGGVLGAEKLLGSEVRPTAVLAPNDIAAVGALEVFESAGFSVPEDISLVGFDDTFLAGMGHVALTTVRQDAEEIGRTAIDLLRERIDDGRTEVRHLVLPPTLTVRATTAPPPG